MKRKFLTLLLAAIICLTTCSTVYAANDTQSTGYTTTKTVDGKKTISQDAYLPLCIYDNLGLNQAQDLFIANEMIYVADTANKRIVCVDITTNAVQIIGADVLKEPRGVSADEKGRIYVADTGAGKAYRFSKDGKLEFTFDKPTEPSYGKKVGYKPTKIAPADEGGAYIISEGTQAGVVHISGYGDFLGYFASNEVSSSLFEKLVDFFLTEEQKSSFLKKTPPSFGNIFKGEDRLVYTINKGAAAKPKKHSINGLNMLSKSSELPEINNAIDMHITKEGRIFVVDAAGIITEITVDGYFLSSFGGSSSTVDRVGLFDVPSGIGVDDSGIVYVLDKEKNRITAFAPSPVQTNIHGAIDKYHAGLYDESQAILTDVLKFNNSSYFAHIYSAKNYMQKTDYESAIYHYKIANEKQGYSSAFWEIRNIWLQNNLIYVIIAIILLVLLFVTCKVLNKKTALFKPLKTAKEKVLSIDFFRDISKIPFAMKHPIDMAYDIRKSLAGGYLSATVIYIALIVLVILYQTATGFILVKSTAEYSVLNTVLFCGSAIALFIVGHHLISSINDGRGTLRSIYITTAYSISPIIIFLPFIILFANVATIDENFFISFALGVLILWCISNLIVGLIEIHEYKFSEIVKNLLVTLFAMGVTILALSVGYLLIKQIFSFIFEIIVEVRLRV